MPPDYSQVILRLSAVHNLSSWSHRKEVLPWVHDSANVLNKLCGCLPVTWFQVYCIQQLQLPSEGDGNFLHMYLYRFAFVSSLSVGCEPQWGGTGECCI